MVFLRISRLVVGFVMAVAAGLVVPAVAVSPAQAAVCNSSTGVSVVVDFGELGGGVRTACVGSGGGKTAAENFEAAGFPLTQVTRQPGFVCRISGAPNSSTESCVNTPPVDAYWGLFRANGSGGGWSYATLGAYSLEIADGQFVAFAFQSTNRRRLPGIEPTRPAKPTPPPTSTPDPEPTKQPGPEQSPQQSKKPKPSTGPGSVSGPDQNRSADPSPSSSPQGDASGEADESESEKLAAKTKRKSGAPESGSGAGSAADSAEDPQEEIGSREAAPDEAPDDVPAWVILLVIFGLAGAAGGATVLRRRAGS